MKKTLLGIKIPTEQKRDILDKILIYTKKPYGHYHVISLNPEILTLTLSDNEFKRVVVWGKQKILDGIGVVIAARVLGVPYGARFNGVDFMQSCLELASKHSLRVMLIGAGPKVAEQVVDCQRAKWPSLDIFGIQGISDIKKPIKEEEENIFSIVADRKPHFVFVSFGSPETELWLYKNRDTFEGTVVASVGGAFDFLSGNVSRAPYAIRSIGFEWLYRLIRQPWRWKRQLRLFKFAWAVLKERVKG